MNSLKIKTIVIKGRLVIARSRGWAGNWLQRGRKELLWGGREWNYFYITKWFKISWSGYKKKDTSTHSLNFLSSHIFHSPPTASIPYHPYHSLLRANHHTQNIHTPLVSGGGHHLWPQLLQFIAPKRRDKTLQVGSSNDHEKAGYEQPPSVRKIYQNTIVCSISSILRCSLFFSHFNFSDTGMHLSVDDIMQLSLAMFFFSLAIHGTP